MKCETAAAAIEPLLVEVNPYEADLFALTDRLVGALVTAGVLAERCRVAASVDVSYVTRRAVWRHYLQPAKLAAEIGFDPLVRQWLDEPVPNEENTDA